MRRPWRYVIPYTRLSICGNAGLVKILLKHAYTIQINEERIEDALKSLTTRY